MGEMNYIHQVYSSYNDQLYEKLKSNNLFDQIILSYKKFNSEKIYEEVSDLMIQEVGENNNSVCMQAITVHDLQSGHGPKLVRMITVFKPPSGEKADMIFCNDPIFTS
jgi:hypothetical protein